MAEFKIKYNITPQYLPVKTKRRSGRVMDKVNFIVAHDTGNPGSTAKNNVAYYTNSANEMSASAHIFVDDTYIIECVPALTSTPEKAWHVLYNVVTDDQLYGCNANDCAIGVEYCYGVNIDADEAYKRYIWVLAYICYTFKLDVKKAITGHFILDPHRKTDPVTGLAHSRRTYDQLLKDVIDEYNECTGGNAPAINIIASTGSVKVHSRLNIRKGSPSTLVPVVRTVPAGDILAYCAYTEDGQSIDGITRWYQDADGNWFWGGATGL
jgi:N-acetylmuramoyl-L-alanine amidase CwlA